MKPVGWTALVGAATVLWMTTSVGCDPTPEVPESEAAEEIIAAVCGNMFDCECGDTRWLETEDACSEAVRNEVRSIQQNGQSVDLIYDARCVGERVEAIEDRGCGPTQPSAQCQAPCHMYHGTKQLGSVCEISGNDFTDCAQGLRCVGGVCERPCGAGAQAGENCQDTPCDDDLFCDRDRQVCMRLPQPGDPCQFGACADGAFCDNQGPDSLCVALGSRGDACSGHTQCVSGYCPAGFCDALPKRGEACTAGLCERGSDCRDGQCVQALAAVCTDPSF